jgi:hypothetical protein
MPYGRGQTMKRILKIISYLGLLLTIVPSLFVLKGVFDMKVHYNLMIVGMVLWFATAPFCMKSSGLHSSATGTESRSLDEKEQ